MLRCPKCNRTYQDDMQKFCTHDGGRLVPDTEKAKSFDPNATVHTDASSLDIPSDPSSVPSPSQDLDITITGSPPASAAPPSAPSTSGFRSPDTAPTTFPETNRLGQPPPPPANYPPAYPSVSPPSDANRSEPIPPAGASPGFATMVSGPPPAPSQSTTSHPGSTQLPSSSEPLPSQSEPLQPQSAPLGAAPKKSKLGLIFGIVGGLVMIIIVSGVVAGYFFFYKGPRRGREVKVEPNIKNAGNTNNSPAMEKKPKPVEAPPGTVKFENSPSNLDGKLAAHYVDFYYFYSQTWEKSQSAGVKGAANFVEVERKLPPDFTQEKLAISWYESKGTVEADLAGKLPELIKERNASLTKGYPEYEKVSEGRTTINGIEGYEFRFKAVSRGTDKGDIYIWGRVVFIPPGDEASTKGVTLYMLTTSLAPELKGVGDVGVKGELPIILNSFTLGKS